MNNLPLHLASLNKLKATVERYSRLIQDKGYSDLNTKKYKSRIESLKNQIDGEIYQIQHKTKLNSQSEFKLIGINLYIKQDGLLLEFQKELNQIHLDMCNESDLIKSEIAKEIEQTTILYTWLLPTSCFTLISQDGKSTYGFKDDLDVIGDFVDNNSNNLCLDDLFLNQLVNPKRIYEILEYWKKIDNLKSRYQILEEGVKNHLDKKFSSSVSTFMPQVEGILRDAIEASGRKAEFNSLDSNEIRKAVDSLEKQWKKNNQDDRILVLLGNISPVIPNLFQECRVGISTLDYLNRHAVLHGLSTTFGNAVNSLKLILILDRIIFFYDDNQSS